MPEREQTPGEALASLNEQMDTLIEAAAGVRAKMELVGFCSDAAQVTALQYLSGIDGPFIQRLGKGGRLNAKPHTHKVRVTREWEYNNSGCYVVIYGDTKVNVHRGPFLDRRMKRGMRRAVTKHDKGTLQAEAKVTRLERYRASLHLPVDASEVWGSDLLKHKAKG